MDKSGLLEAWWMPEGEEAFWEISRLTAFQRITFYTGVFVIGNSISHSFANFLMGKQRLSSADQILVRHRIVQVLYLNFMAVYSLFLLCGWIEGDNSFLKGRIFGVNPFQELLSALQSAYSVYSIGISLFCFTAFGRNKVWLNVARGSFILGLNYLWLIYPCLLGYKLRIFWSIGDIGLLASSLTKICRSLKIQPKTVIMMCMGSMLLCLARFWLMVLSLMYSYQWVSSEGVWDGVPSDIPVSDLSSAYIPGTGVGAIAMTCLAFLDFREVIDETKEWSKQYKRG